MQKVKELLMALCGAGFLVGWLWMLSQLDDESRKQLSLLVMLTT